MLEEQSIKEKLANLKTASDEFIKKLDLFLELINSAYLSYQSGTPEQKRELVKTVFSNCEIEDKNILFKPFFPFQLTAARPLFTAGSPYREAARTFGKLFKKLLDYFEKMDNSKSPDEFSKYINSKNEIRSKRYLPKSRNLFSKSI